MNTNKSFKYIGRRYKYMYIECSITCESLLWTESCWLWCCQTWSNRQSNESNGDKKSHISLYEGLSLMCHHAWCNYSCRFPMHLHQPEAVLYHNCHDLVNLLLTSANFMDLHQGLYRDSVSGKLACMGSLSILWGGGGTPTKLIKIYTSG